MTIKIAKTVCMSALLLAASISAAPMVAHADGYETDYSYYNAYDVYSYDDYYTDYDYYNSYDVYDSYDSGDYYTDYDYYNSYDVYDSYSDSYTDYDYYNSYDVYQPYYSGYSYSYNEPYYYSQPSYGYQHDYSYVYNDYNYNDDYHYHDDRPTYDRPDCTLEASDRSIDEGDYVTLTWDANDADDATLTGFGDVNPNGGSERIRLSNDKTFTLRVEGRGGSESCSVTVNVDEDNHNHNTNNDISCDLEASDESIDEGDRVRLTWDTKGTVDDARINNGVGSVDEDGGSEYVYPDRDTRYTLTVENDDGDEDTCSVSINVDDGQTPPDVPLVYLSQLPYTGAGDGPLYWMLLIVGSGILGYALFFRALPFAYARVKSLRSELPEAEEKPVGEGETAPQNVTRQDVRAFVSALSEGDTASAREFARTGGKVLFAETAVILDDVVRARAAGGVADPMIKEMTKTWDASKFGALIEAFAGDDESAVEKALV